MCLLILVSVFSLSIHKYIHICLSPFSFASFLWKVVLVVLHYIVYKYFSYIVCMAHKKVTSFRQKEIGIV